MKLYISTLAFKNLTIEELINIAKEKNWAIEFSSGIPFHEGNELIYQEAPIEKIPHNYFPAPQIPFVLNLASSNPEIRQKSIDHCKKGLQLAKLANAPFFSAHAGFCIDPNPNELGRKIEINSVINKEVHMDYFIESIHEVLNYAVELNLDFLIENNVIAPFNLVGNVNPLLCTCSEEIIEVLERVNRSNFHLLLDTGHLKVSCQTLSKDIDEEIKKLNKYIKAIHHSDNDGLKDSNDLLDQNYWFRKNISNFSDIIHVLEVKAQSIFDIESQIKLINTWM
ncbi:sugar phosphate isomerase/epimerase family protein [Aquirufa sp. Wall-65K1]